MAMICYIIFFNHLFNLIIPFCARYNQGFFLKFVKKTNEVPVYHPENGWYTGTYFIYKMFQFNEK